MSLATSMMCRSNPLIRAYTVTTTKGRQKVTWASSRVRAPTFRPRKMKNMSSEMPIKMSGLIMRMYTKEYMTCRPRKR